MKSYRHKSKQFPKKVLIEFLILNSLPYGKWTTKDNKEFLFNRDYEPILGWDLTTNTLIPVHPKLWIKGIDTKEYFYETFTPIDDVKTFRKCWDILTEWSRRSNE